MQGEMVGGSAETILLVAQVHLVSHLNPSVNLPFLTAKIQQEVTFKGSMDVRTHGF